MIAVSAKRLCGEGNRSPPSVLRCASVARRIKRSILAFLPSVSFWQPWFLLLRSTSDLSSPSESSAALNSPRTFDVA
jgi:hypothetical protein